MKEINCTKFCKRCRTQYTQVPNVHKEDEIGYWWECPAPCNNSHMVLHTECVVFNHDVSKQEVEVDMMPPRGKCECHILKERYLKIYPNGKKNMHTRCENCKKGLVLYDISFHCDEEE